MFACDMLYLITQTPRENAKSGPPRWVKKELCSARLLVGRSWRQGASRGTWCPQRDYRARTKHNLLTLCARYMVMTPHSKCMCRRENESHDEVKVRFSAGSDARISMHASRLDVGNEARDRAFGTSRKCKRPNERTVARVSRTEESKINDGSAV